MATQTEIPGVQMSKPHSKKGGNSSGYVPDTELPLAKRIAHFLDWAAVHRPKEFIQYPEITKEIMGYNHMPRAKTEEVKHIQKTASRSRNILRKEYKRGMVSKLGLGVRATVDDADMTMNVLTKRAKTLAGAGAKFVETHSDIDPTKLSSTGEVGKFKDWYLHEATDTAKKLTAPAFKQNLLPPGSPDKK